MFSFARFGNDLYTGKRSFPIIAKRRLWFTIALTLMALSLLVLGVRGLNPGIEFRGGSEFTLSNVANTSGDPARDVLAAEGVTEAPRITTVGGSTLRVQTAELDSEQISAVRAGLAEAYEIGTEAVTSTYIGPSWGADVTQKAVQGLVLFLVLVSLVMATYFRTWKMAAAAVAALLHDLVITVGLYALIGFEITPASVIGFLTILGYSLYDTVVVFDKVRENTARLEDQDRVTYAEAANLAVNQTLVRSINTSVVGVLPVASILFVGVLLLGAGTLRDIALALFIGMIVSTISSIFIATPLLVELRSREAPVAAHTARVLRNRAERSERGEATSDRMAASVLGTTVIPGGHMGQAAQPRRKKKDHR
ncbi:MAG: protein translocase subunit SecF [Actinomycetota bacterium]